MLKVSVGKMDEVSIPPPPTCHSPPPTPGAAGSSSLAAAGPGLGGADAEGRELPPRFGVVRVDFPPRAS